MSGIKLKIETADSGGQVGTITNYVFDDPSGSNLSNTSYQVNIYGEFETDKILKGESSNGLSLASINNELDLVFGEDDNLANQSIGGGVVEDEVDPSEFIWGIVPSNGQYSVKLTFDGAKSLKRFTVTGDSAVNQFPTEAIINGSKTITNSELEWEINFDEQLETQEVEFTRWNLTNYNACVVGFSIGQSYIELGREFVNNFSSLSQTTTTPSAIGYGVLANSGTAEINDINGKLRKYIEDGTIENSNVKIELFINDNKIQTHITSDSDYIEEGEKLSLQLTNGLSRWGEINYKGKELVEGMYAYDLLVEVLGTLAYTNSQIETMLSNKMVFGKNNTQASIKEYLQTIYIPYAYLSSGTYLETINKFCDMAQLYVYADENDLPMFASARPVASQTEINNAVKVGAGMQISNAQKTIMVKNKYDAVELNQQLVKKEFQTDAAAYNTTFNVSSTFNSATYGKDTTFCMSRIDAYYAEGDLFIPETEDLGKIKYLRLTSKTQYSASNKNRCYRARRSRIDLTSFLNYAQDTTTPLNFDTMVNLVYSGEVEKNDTKYANNKVYENIEGTLYNKDQNYYSSYFFTNYDQTRKEFSFIASDDIHNCEAIATHKDNSSVTVTPVDGGYNLHYNILSKLLLCGQYDDHTSGSTTTHHYLVSEKESQSIDMTIYGDKRTIIFEDIIASSPNISSAKTIARLNNNELMQTGTLIEGTPIVEYIKSNIDTDYRNGVRSGTSELFVGNYYNSNNEKIIDFKSGQILKPNDIIYYSGDLKPNGEQRYWRVTGRNFRFEGQPINPVEIQEITDIY